MAYLRANKLAISVFDNYEQIVDRCCEAWNFFANDKIAITSITTRQWAKRSTTRAVGIIRTMAGSQIKSWGMRLMRTKGRRRAVVAVARKLAVLLHRMWIDGTEFRQEKVGGVA